MVTYGIRLFIMNPVIILFLAYVLFVAYVGYGLGKSNLRIRRALTAVTVVVAVILHGTWQLTLPHAEIDRIAPAVAQRRRPTRSPGHPRLARGRPARFER